jgi:hypothetical protein
MEDKSLDILGIKPYGEILKIVTKESVDGVKKFLEIVCKPAAEEFGFLLSDKIRIWRLGNIIKILEKSNGKLEFNGEKIQLKKIHPKLINRIFEDGSLESDEQIQECWAGLIASSAEEFPNDNNIIYFEILRQLTKSELLLLKYFCENSEIETNPHGLIQTEKGIRIDAEELFSIVNSNDLNQLNTEINHLKGLDLVEQGFGLASGFFEEEGILKVGLKMSPLAINLLRKCL